MKAMKQNQQQLQENLSEKSLFIKMATKFLIPVSVVSILFSYSSLVSFFLQVFHFSYNNEQLIISSGYSIDKSFMFLLCNGILVFIVTNSGVIDKSPAAGANYDDLGDARNVIKKTDSEQLQKAVKLPEEKVEMEGEEVEEEAHQTEQWSGAVASAAQEDEDDGQENEFLVIEEEEEEEGFGLLSADELNKKCEDFIRKMKQGIKFEAQQLTIRA